MSPTTAADLNSWVSTNINTDSESYVIIFLPLSLCPSPLPSSASFCSPRLSFDLLLVILNFILFVIVSVTTAFLDLWSLSMMAFVFFLFYFNVPLLSFPEYVTFTHFFCLVCFPWTTLGSCLLYSWYGWCVWRVFTVFSFFVPSVWTSSYLLPLMIIYMTCLSDCSFVLPLYLSFSTLSPVIIQSNFISTLRMDNESIC